MSSSLLGVASLVGVCLAAGLFLVVLSLLPAPARLSDALAHVAGVSESAQGRLPAGVALLDDQSGRLERAGVSAYQRFHLPLSERQSRMLALQGRSIGDFFAEKFVFATAGFALPILWTVAGAVVGKPVTPMPLIVSLLAAAAGYVIPDLRLRRSRSALQQSASEAVFTFFDLITLERLANQSASQAVHSAASVSDGPVFVRIRAALERARLEQVAPWEHLRLAARDLETPEIADMADVLQLDEQGAALADALRARVRELRDGSLNRVKQEAQATTERMTIWMTLPAIIFGLIFLAAPLLRLLAS